MVLHFGLDQTEFQDPVGVEPPTAAISFPDQLSCWPPRPASRTRYFRRAVCVSVDSGVLLVCCLCVGSLDSGPVRVWGLGYSYCWIVSAAGGAVLANRWRNAGQGMMANRGGMLLASS